MYNENNLLYIRKSVNDVNTYFVNLMWLENNQLKVL